MSVNRVIDTDRNGFPGLAKAGRKNQMTDQEKASLKAGDRIRYIAGGLGDKIENPSNTGLILSLDDTRPNHRTVMWADGATLELWAIDASDIQIVSL